MCLTLALTGCGGPRPCAPQPQTAAVYFVSRGWHVEIGIPADQLTGKLARFRTIFPGARAVMFGYGKRTFMTAPTDDVREYLLGPVPGPAVIEAFGLTSLPPAAYGWNDVEALRLPPGGALRLSNFIWNDLRHGRQDAPLLVGPGKFPGSLFYAANSEYNLLHTCNRWAMDAAQAAGLNVAPDGVILSGQAMARIGRAASLQCRNDQTRDSSFSEEKEAKRLLFRVRGAWSSE